MIKNIGSSLTVANSTADMLSAISAILSSNLFIVEVLKVSP